MSIVYESFMELVSTRLSETFDALKTPAEKRKLIGKFYKLKKGDTTKPDFKHQSKSAAQQEFAEQTFGEAGASGAVLTIILDYGVDFEVFDQWAEDAWDELYPESDSDDDDSKWVTVYQVQKGVDSLCGPHQHLQMFRTSSDDIGTTTYYQTHGGGPEGGYFHRIVNKLGEVCREELYSVYRTWGEPFSVEPVKFVRFDVSKEDGIVTKCRVKY